MAARQVLSVVAVCLCRVGCAAAGIGLCACPKAGTEPMAATATAAPSPPWWMSITDGKVHRGLDEAPIGLYVAGTFVGERFVGGGNIEGSGPIGALGRPGWLELVTGRFVAQNEPMPVPPYVPGAMTPSGFSPATRKVQYTSEGQHR